MRGSPDNRRKPRTYVEAVKMEEREELLAPMRKAFWSLYHAIDESSGVDERLRQAARELADSVCERRPDNVIPFPGSR